MWLLKVKLSSTKNPEYFVLLVKKVLFREILLALSQ